MSMIDREYVLNTFINYVKDYDINDPKIRLKVEHTKIVAILCDKISASLHLSEEDISLAWLIGMLHDIGRFEQVRRYNTFNDAESVNHAKLGADLLFVDGLINNYAELTLEEKHLIEVAIRNHNEYKICDGLSERELTLCKIIRDADKIDILRANSEFSMEDVYNVTTEEIRSCSISKEVLDAFDEQHAILRSLKRTAADHRIGIISLIYELEYPASYLLLKEQGYYKTLFSYPSDNSDTREKFDYISTKMNEYINLKIASI